MNDMFDELAQWMHREPWATGWLILCAYVAAQTFLICGR